MGITNLAKLIGDCAPNAIKENEIKNFFGRKIAIDASMCIYQFLIAVRQGDGNSLTNEDGETTSHLMGMFYRTIRLLENGIKPVYVFDGKPPDMKGGELEKRKERRAEAEVSLEKATENGDQENIEKFSRRLVKVTKEHGEDCRKLLKFMGVPFVEAPSEAEAQCCELVKAGVCYGVGTEDMDALTFGTHVLLRHLTFSEARKMPIKEFHISKVLEGFQLNMNEFIDLCILMGCDYCDSIKGIGPKRAIELIQKHKSIEAILEHIDTKKYIVPENWLYKQARELFLHPDVTEASKLEIKWTDVDQEGLIDYMVNQKGFNEDRMRNGIAKILKSKSANTQVRLDSFFKITSSPAIKRKPEETKENDKKKQAKGKGMGKKFR